MEPVGKIRLLESREMERIAQMEGLPSDRKCLISALTRYGSVVDSFSWLFWDMCSNPNSWKIWLIHFRRYHSSGWNFGSPEWGVGTQWWLLVWGRFCVEKWSCLIIHSSVLQFLIIPGYSYWEFSTD